MWLWQRRQWHPTPVRLPGKSHGQRSLVGCSPWGREESDTTEQLHFHFHAFGERNGNPLQCCCLENPRDGAAWWAAVYGVAQSRTWLKWHSSSSMWLWGLSSLKSVGQTSKLELQMSWCLESKIFSADQQVGNSDRVSVLALRQSCSFFWKAQSLPWRPSTDWLKPPHCGM